jgi:hypothetical protein
MNNQLLKILIEIWIKFFKVQSHLCIKKKEIYINR